VDVASAKGIDVATNRQNEYCITKEPGNRKSPGPNGEQLTHKIMNIPARIKRRKEDAAGNPEQTESEKQS